MTQWHQEWQGRFPTEWCEVTVGAHRADVLVPDSYTVEFQHSPISVGEILERERHYGPNMIWVFDAIDAYREDRLNLRRKVSGSESYRSFRWKHAKTSLQVCQRPVFLDLGNNSVLRLMKLYFDKPPRSGWGNLCSADDLVDALRNSAKQAA